MGRAERLPHTLVPLTLAAALIRCKLAPAGSPATADLDAVATFIASTVPIWEYSDDTEQPPRRLSNPAQGVFREGGGEVRFLDGRPSKRLLAVQSDDINCVVEMVERPLSAVRVRSRVLRALARKLVQQSRESVAAAKALRVAWASRGRNRGDLSGV